MKQIERVNPSADKGCQEAETLGTMSSIKRRNKGATHMTELAQERKIVVSKDGPYLVSGDVPLFPFKEPRSLV